MYYNHGRITLCCSTTESAGSTAPELISDFLAVITAYGINKADISAIVTDTEPTMNAFGRLMRQEHGIQWIGCVDHILELVTGKAFDDDKYEGNIGCMRAARKLVGVFRHSNMKMDQLKSIQRSTRNDDSIQPVIPIEDCATRWWSTFTMLERLCSLKHYFNILEREGSLDSNLSDDQWRLADDLVKVLKPFMSIQKYFEGERYVTISTVCQLIENIRSGIQTIVQTGSGDRGVNQIVRGIVDKFEESWGNGLDPFSEHTRLGPRKRVKGYQPSHFLSTILDPRSKNLPMFDEITKGQIREILLEEMQTYSESTPAPIANPSRPNNSSSDIAGISFLDCSDEIMLEDKSVHSELERYLTTPRITYVTIENGEKKWLNPLDWWRSNSRQYPVLAALAKKYLCIPATSAPSERLFSKAGLTITEKRNRLRDDVAADLIFLNANWKFIEDDLALETSDLARDFEE
jgi:hypothetical protein